MKSYGISVLLVMKRGRVEESMRTLLNALSYMKNIFQADEVQTVLNIMSSRRPDIVIFDFDVNNDSPLSILSLIKDNYKRTRCIAIADSSFQLKLARDAGVEHTMLKGFLAGELFEAINDLLSMPKNSNHQIQHSP